MLLVLIRAKKAKGQGFNSNGSGKKPKTWKATSDIFPCELSPETEAHLKEAVKLAVDNYGFQSLSELDADEKNCDRSGKKPPSKIPS